MLPPPPHNRYQSHKDLGDIEHEKLSSTEHFQFIQQKRVRHQDGKKEKNVKKFVSKKRGGGHDRLPATLTRSSPLQQQFL
jgi:hypothetical protein